MLWRGIYVYAAQAAKRVADQVATEEKVRRDVLTRLPNRLAFFEAVEAALERLANWNEKFAVLFLDLNDFKVVNDRFGHATGDKLLAQVGQRLQGCVNQADLVARLGGDEFAVVVVGARDSVAANNIATQIVGSVERPFILDGTEVLTGSCVGIALAPADGNSPEQLLKSADEALYEAKHSNRGVIQHYDRHRKAANRRRRIMERDLRYALQRNEFSLVFQPIFDVKNNQVAGCEALLRWNHPTFGLRLPDDFIEAAERIRLINEIGPWIFHEACSAAATWPKNIRLAVNVSATQLRHAVVLSSITSALTLSTLTSGRLEIEITETAVLDDQCLSNIKALRQLGISVALDDFGTGYSSLTYLQKLSPDRIKIDAPRSREQARGEGDREVTRLRYPGILALK